MLEKIEKFQILILGLVLALGGIIAVGMVTNSMSNDTISVTGSYSQNVTSDSGMFEITLSSRKANKALSYGDLNRQTPIVVSYFEKQENDKKDIDVKNPSGYDVYELNYNGNSTNKIIGFNATKYITVTSKDVEKIKKVSSDIIELNSQDVDLSVSAPSYFYSKLSDLKVEMLEKATKDAHQRASAMLKATHNKVGKIKSVQMGVFQITPVDSTEVSDYGINDTSSIEKKITSVANVKFRVK